MIGQRVTVTHRNAHGLAVPRFAQTGTLQAWLATSCADGGYITTRVVAVVITDAGHVLTPDARDVRLAAAVTQNLEAVAC